MNGKNTKQIRIIFDGKFAKYMKMIKDTFLKKHAILLHDKDICETIAKALEDGKIVWN